jgi:ketosteroid isomerase-like protein
MSEPNKELVRRHSEEIWNRKDLAVADELMGEDYLEHAVAPFGQAEPGKINGPAAMRQTAEWLLAQFPDLHMTIEAMVAEGDTVAVRVLSEGTNLRATVVDMPKAAEGRGTGRNGGVIPPDSSISLPAPCTTPSASRRRPTAGGPAIWRGAPPEPLTFDRSATAMGIGCVSCSSQSFPTATGGQPRYPARG